MRRGLASDGFYSLFRQRESRLKSVPKPLVFACNSGLAAPWLGSAGTHAMGGRHPLDQIGDVVDVRRRIEGHVT